jgi:hypothetical protein
MTNDSPSTSSTARAPRRSTKKMLLALGISAAVLCAIPFLPKEARLITIALAAPLAAATLPSIFFAAANTRCPACQKALPLAYEGTTCPACNAPLDLKSQKPSPSK